MKHLSKDWEKIKKKIKEAYLYLFLDFDGTITPIKKYPKGVVLSKRMRSVIEDLSVLKDISVAVISGRELGELKSMTGIKNIGYIGNHGLEGEVTGTAYEVKEALKTEPLIRKINKQLRNQLKTFKGIIVENKRLSLSVHYRAASAADVKKAKKVLFETIKLHNEKRKIKVRSGKKVWEIRPRIGQNKGTAALELLTKKTKSVKKKITPIYIGDDITDEDAFKVLRRRGYAIRVSKNGTGNTYAEFYLRNVNEVKKILKEIIILKRG